MGDIFSQVLNMSLTGSAVILLVLLARSLLRNSPKIYSYALWAVVLFRLLCPVSLSAPVSVLEVFQPEVTLQNESTSVVSYLPAQPRQTSDFTFVPARSPSDTPATIGEMEQPDFDLMTGAACVWLAGAGVMLLYSAASYFRLRRKLIGAMPCRRDVYLADHIDTPFVMGVLRPRIYMPSNVPRKERTFIIAHERHHIRRLDHILKLLAYTALCLHWFNPLVWTAFILAGKDMEMSCDEAVIRKLGPQIRADYSASLLRLATHRKIIAGMPLAFGEGDTKGRVLNMAKWKKPKLWMSMICLLLCAAVLVACAVNPAPQEEDPMPTVALGTKAANGYVSRIPFTIGQLPEGYDYEVDAFGDILFTDGVNPVGGITVYAIPEGVYDPADDIFLWLEEVGIPDFEDTSLCYMGGTTAWDNGWIAEFASDVPEGVERTVHRRHHFYPIGDRVYDIWFDMLLVSIETSEELRTAVDHSGESVQRESGELTPVIGDSEIVTGTELVQYGALKLLLPEGFGSREQDGAVVLTRNGEDVGGITCYSTPDFALEMPGNMSEWVDALGLPERRMDLDPIASLISNSLHGDLEAEFFYELDPARLNTEHHFYIDGNLVYDIWYDQNLLNDGDAEKILKTAALNGAPAAGETTAEAAVEAAAFEKCRAVMDAVQNGSYYILSDTKQTGEIGVVTDHESQYLSHENGDWLNIFDIDPKGLNLSDNGDYTARVAFMYADDTFYTNEGSAGDAYTEIDWQVDAYPEDPASPWLARFLLVKANATYIDTLTDDEGECVMFRIDKKYEDREEFSDSYFANFYFDAEGNFRNVALQVNLFLDSEFSVTESIVSLDPETVASEIEKEYRRAIG